MVNTKNIEKGMFKALAYPTLGNLSHKIKSDLEGLVGKEWFDNESATKASYLTNVLGYAALFGFLCSKIPNLDVGDGISFGFLTGLMEMFGRYAVSIGAFNNPANSSASLLGKAVSLPYDIVGALYDLKKGKNRDERNNHIEIG